MNNGKPIVAIIGLGHLGTLLAIILSKVVSPEQIIFGRISEHRLAAIKDQFPDCNYADTNAAAIREADIVFLAVRPVQANTILTPAELSALDTECKVFVSCMAAVNFDQLRSMFGSDRIIKCAVTIGIELGIGPIVYRPFLGHKTLMHGAAFEILADCGQLIPAESESEIDHAIVSSGSLFALIVDHIGTYTDASINMFADRKKVREVIARTFIAAGQYCLAHEELSEQEIIDSIATKGGITAIMLEKLLHAKISQSMRQAIAFGLTRMKEVIKLLHS